METLARGVLTCSAWLRPHLREISISLVATLLFLYGAEIHGLSPVVGGLFLLSGILAEKKSAV